MGAFGAGSECGMHAHVAGDERGDLNRNRRARPEGWEAKRRLRGGGSGASQSEIGHEGSTILLVVFLNRRLNTLFKV